MNAGLMLRRHEHFRVIVLFSLLLVAARRISLTRLVSAVGTKHGTTWGGRKPQPANGMRYINGATNIL